jgi:hypothetical protein
MELLKDKNYVMSLHELRTMRVQPIGAIIDTLNARRSQIKIIIAARKSGLGKDERLKTLQCVFDDGAYCGTVIEILSEEMPLMNMDMEDCWDDDGNYVLAINPNSFSTWNFDDADDHLSSIVDAMPWFSLTAFLLLLNVPFMDSDLPDYWENAIDHFNWPFTEPVSLDYSIPIDEKFLKRYLQKRKLPELYRAVEQAFFPPYNVFLNCNIEDPDSVYFEFNTENLKMLRRDWKIAKPYLLDFESASEMVANDPGLLRILYDGLRGSQLSSMKKSGASGIIANHIPIPADIILRRDVDPLYTTDDVDMYEREETDHD